MANAIQHPQIEKLAVWPYQTTNANRGTVPLPTVIWLGFTDNPDAIESFSLVRLIGNTIIRTRGQMIPGTDYTKSSDFAPGLSDAKQYTTFEEAYEAANKMIFNERIPHETKYHYDKIWLEECEKIVPEDVREEIEDWVNRQLELLDEAVTEFTSNEFQEKIWNLLE